MRKSLLCLTCLVCLGATAQSPAWAADANSQAVRDSSPQATTQPAAATQPAIPDVLGGAVDPYQPGLERASFFKAAGVDNELDAKEFSAARKKTGAFVRKFDKWKTLLAFDKDRNGSIDWFEAEAYRKDVRRRVLSAFDANRDGWLTGQERKAANKMLSAGRLPGRSPVLAKRVVITEPTTAPADEQTGKQPRDASAEMRERMLRLRQKVFAKYDTNGDGKIDADEHDAMVGAVADSAQAEIDQLEAQRWDTDRDGQLNEQEAAAMEADLAERKLRDQRDSDLRDLRRWDADGDGQLDEQETAAMDEARERQLAERQRWREQADLQRFDLDGDGQLDEQEKLLADAEAVRRDIYAQASSQRDRGRNTWQATMTQWRLRNFDADGDGRINDDEQAEVSKFERQLREVGQSFQRSMADLDRDGEVTPAEQQAVRQEWQKAGWTIFAKTFRYMDADGDGQISLQERSDFQRRMQGRTIGYLERFSASFDSNRDGRLDAQERENFVTGMTEQFGQRIEKFDTDRDGRLSPKEAIALMEDFVQKELGIRPAAPATPPAKQ